MTNKDTDFSDPRFLSQDEFGDRLKTFREKHGLSVAGFARIFALEPNTSRSTLYRLEKRVLRRDVYEKVVPVLEDGLYKWMVEKGFSEEEIYEDLVTLLNFQERIMIVNRCELISSAVKFFGLSADPFDVDRVPTDEELFTNRELDDVAERVKDAILYKRFVCVAGGVGTGKTSLKIRVERELAGLPQKVHLIHPEFFDMNAVNVGAIASYILEEFEVRAPQASTARVRKIKQLLTSLEKDDARIALVFDECHRLNERVLISLKNFWEMTNGGYNRLLGVVLFGQPRFVEATLRDYRFREIAERVQVLQMPPIAKSAKDYLRHKIASVGGDMDRLFDAKSVERICAIATTPLALGNLTNTALMEAYRLEEKRVVSTMLNLPDVPRVRNLRHAA
ncbi:MAG TPA: AAA family ATPase [Aridibacter sp.]|nr:AAA family ATPase [Aridibacter sp.]